jgi:hypothetical protein
MMATPFDKQQEGQCASRGVAATGRGNTSEGDKLKGVTSMKQDWKVSGGVKRQKVEKT